MNKVTHGGNSWTNFALPLYNSLFISGSKVTIHIFPQTNIAKKALAYGKSPREKQSSLSILFLEQLGGILSLYRKHSGETREEKPLSQLEGKTDNISIVVFFVIHLDLDKFVDMELRATNLRGLI